MKLPTCHLPRSLSNLLVARLGWPMLLACGVLVTGPPIHASSLRISGDLTVGGDVSAGFQINPGGTQVLYVADQVTDGVDELFNVPIGGGTPVRINGALVAGGDVSSFQISSGDVVIYIADQVTDEVFEVFSVSIGGGTPVKINGALVAGGDVSSFQISPAGTRVVYTADQVTNDVIELISVPIGGGTPVKLNATLVAGGDVSTEVQISPDGTRVVYIADQVTDEVFELFSVPIGGGTPVKINGALVASGDVSSFQISPGGGVIYIADQVTDGVDELYSVPIGGGTPVKLNVALVAGGGVSSFQISPDGTRVVYVADQETDGVNELYSMPASGGTPVKLNGTLVADGDVSPEIQISPDGTQVVYAADQVTDEVFELFSVPIGGGTPAKINGALVAGGDVSSFQIGPGGSVIYVADQVTDGVDEIFSVPIGGGDPFKLNGALAAGGDVSPDFQINPNGSRVVYAADQVTDEVIELFVARGLERWVASGGGDWDAAANWEFGVVPDSTTDAVIEASAVVTLVGDATPTLVNTLTIGGGAGTSTLRLFSDDPFGPGNLSVLAAAEGVTLLDGGVLSGDGILSSEDSPLAITAGGQVRASIGDQLRLATGPVDNAGSIEALGGALTAAEIEFSGPVTNQAGTGFITGHDATLRFGAGLTNAGFFTLSRGFNDIFGEITNQATGRIVVTGGATAIFYDDVANSGSIQVSSSGTLRSIAVFYGALGGNGISGGGIVFIEGDARPGFSAGTMSYGGDVSFGPSATLHMEIGGTAPGTQYDQLSVIGELVLGGTLKVSLTNDFVPVAGMTFDLWNAGTSSGAFASLVLPPLPDGLSWNTSQVNTTGVLSVDGATQDSYAEFASFYGLTEPPEGDDENDGISNLEEYGLGLNPQIPDRGAPGLPSFLKSGSDDVFTFDMPAASAPDIELKIQSSLDMLSWTVLATRTAGGPWTGPIPPALSAPVGGMHTVTLTRPDGGEPKRFYRLLLRLLP